VLYLSQHCVFCCKPQTSLSSRLFCAMSIASFTERLFDFRSCWIVFIHIVRGRAGGILQFSQVEAVKILAFLFVLAFGHSGSVINRMKCRAWTTAERYGCPVVHLTSSFCTWWYRLILTAFANTTDQGHQS